MSENCKSVHLNRDYDPEYRLKDVLFHLLYRWRSILLVTLLCAVVFGGLQALSTNAARRAGNKTKDELRYEQDMAAYQKCKVDFVLEKPKKKKSIKVEETYADIKNPKLIKILTKWRTTHAKEDGIPAYVVLTQKSLLAIADQLPHDRKSLLKIHGIGAAKVNLYGAEIIQMVEDYCYDMEHPKEPAFQQAARLFAEGKSVEDVAGEMLRAVSTVEGYLITAVEKGILDPDLIIDSQQQDEILSYMLEHPELTALKPVYEHFEGRYGYLQLRVARILSHDIEPS